MAMRARLWMSVWIWFFVQVLLITDYFGPFPLVHYVMSAKRSRMEHISTAMAENRGRVTAGHHSALNLPPPEGQQSWNCPIPSRFIPRKGNQQKLKS